MAYPQYQQPYPYQYQPQVPAPMDRLSQLQAQYQMSQQPTSNQNLLYVQGESAAKSWMVGAGQSVLLMDSENPVFYIKSADNSGIPLPLRVFDYTERLQNTPQNAPQSPQSVQENLDDKYVTRQEYDALQGKYMEILERLNNFPAPAVVAEDGKRPVSATNKSRNRGGNDNVKSDI